MNLILLYKVVSVFFVVANRWTDIVLIYSEASYRSWEGFKLFLLLFWNSNLKWDEIDFSPFYRALRGFKGRIR